jgi:hypothetical protein
MCGERLTSACEGPLANSLGVSSLVGLDGVCLPKRSTSSPGIPSPRVWDQPPPDLFSVGLVGR